ncbi:hypothetical protein scyTo_0020736 [Scyliorhinus torazame]|uniref:Chemokine interleukin-8-like domain-containing protein n=1 Tax=Scyliorhinus torazame TaxID=75743 RepID=A0A401Q0Q8_SCYTO|nr:hypothetical protein [Scyliorhinus torazame]
MMILCSTHFSNAQSPDRCQCHQPIKFRKQRQIVNYSITQQTVNCKAPEIRVWLKGEKTPSCLDPNTSLAKRLLSCAQRHRYNPGQTGMCLCKLNGYTNSKCHQRPAKRYKGRHVMLRSLNR